MHDTERDDPEFGRVMMVNTLAVWQMVTWIVLGLVFLALAWAAAVLYGRKPAGPVAGIVFAIGGLMLIGVAIKKLAAGGSETKVFYERGVRVMQGGNVRSLAYRDATVRSFVYRGEEHVLELKPHSGGPVIRGGVFTSSSPAKRQEFERLKAAVTAAAAGDTAERLSSLVD